MNPIKPQLPAVRAVDARRPSPPIPPAPTRAAARRSPRRLLFIGAAVAALAALSAAVTPPPPQVDDPLAADRAHEYVLVLAIDLSGSYAEKMTADGHAYRFLMKVIERYSRGRGAHDRIVVVQLSANNRPLLWDGTPTDLRRDFASADAFRAYLLKRADPNGSRLHDGIAEAIRYALLDPNVASGKAKSALFVLSDMIDNDPTPDQTEERLKKALADYATKGGIAGFYWVNQVLLGKWRANLRDAGLKSFVVDPEMVEHPALPTFE